MLIRFAHSPDVEISHQACGVLANLAEALENQGPMVDSGLLQHLKFVLRAKSIDVQREAGCERSPTSALSTHTLLPSSLPERSSR